MLAPTDEKETETGDVGKKDDAANKTNSAGATESKESKVEVVYKFCDKMTSMINAWKKHFAEYIPDRVQVSYSDQVTVNVLIFRALVGYKYCQDKQCRPRSDCF